MPAASSGYPEVHHLAGDLTDATFPEQLFQATLDALGSIDIIVNNAGYTWDNVIQKTTDEQFQAMLDILTFAKPRRQKLPLASA
jgi:NAD(P)-dependent dehydrogenase (short-subunit alcohol dehydrogenase family)